jgi:hypothetical protein
VALRLATVARTPFCHVSFTYRWRKTTLGPEVERVVE